MILDCYRLAKFYSVDPNVFLKKPMSQLNRHLEWTNRLIERINIEQSVDND